ncbi:TlyA family RNA methyltransferase [Hyphobacterium sp. HN65]|uniref:TlyA family RNA methyltransferase n=1 Tax=Hyphobacterium lacteum TaxID=3116575 RepID=A0ABU7LMW6_9PROT|nr:TlyA family RNA methyltransferase [Hyphobacterium sp. HN65]MEE2525222.1 TlyA family RNA methyltransferase [Hyphobacterium sp. HN65]
MSKSRLDVYLVEHCQFESRARAREAIEAGLVRLDGKVVRKASTPVTGGARVEAEALHPFVSRAALKLKKALETFDVAVAGKHCLDIGTSTGGFVEVLLEAGAARVIGVDVGSGQLHPRLREDERVTSLEAQDARDLTESMVGRPAVITCDASFIGLAKVIEIPLSLAADPCDLIALFKPQFEVGRSAVGKGGIVKDNAALQAALERFRIWLNGRYGFEIRKVTDSPIKGGDGNREFLIHARKG